MKFRIYRTTDYMASEPTKPCENAICVSDGAIEGTVGAMFQKVKPYHWEIEINTLEELIALGDETGHEIIVWDGGIEIYDGWRE